MTLRMLLIALSLVGLWGCYDMARKMDHRTAHGIRTAVIVIGIGCATAGLWADWSLAILLFGCGLYRVFDRRAQADNVLAGKFGRRE